MAQISEVVPVYIKLRDKIEEIEKKHKEELKPLNAKLEFFDTWLLGELLKRGEQSVNIKGIGTVAIHKKSTCTVKDWDATFAWIQEHQRWDILNHAVNKTVVQAHVEANQEAPPGVDYKAFNGVQVTRARST